jgi:hypothetical protein
MKTNKIKKTYGTTIWGAELLKVLEQKTDSGRLATTNHSKIDSKITVFRKLKVKTCLQ